MTDRKTQYPTQYDPTLLTGIKRVHKRKEISYNHREFMGEDIWTIYEFSHLLENHYPRNSIFTLIYNQSSDKLLESKSLKLYLNSFNNFVSNFNNINELLHKDLSITLSNSVLISYINMVNKIEFAFNGFKNLDSVISHVSGIYHKGNLLNSISIQKTQRFVTNLFRSCCPITGQADWATIYICISGKNGVEPISLLDYLISFRNHQEFHEQCIERIILKLREITEAESISVYARFTRRGGIDINPYRYYGDLDKKMDKLIKYSKAFKFKDVRQ